MSAANALRIGVLLGSTREGRFGIHVANAVVNAIKLHGHNVTLFDAKELKIPLLEKPLHHYKTADDPAPQWMADLGKQFEAQDGFIVVDGEYNHGPTPGILNLLDHFYGGMWKLKPAAIATYGALAGGARSAYALRNTLGELGLVVAPTLFSVPNIWTQLDFANPGEFNNDLPKDALTKFVKEYLFLANTLSEARKDAPL